MTQRTSIFATPSSESIDISDFKPKTSQEERPRLEDLDEANKGSRFRSREPETLPTIDSTKTKRIPMIYRTGRNQTFSVKATSETIAQFYYLAEQNGWKAGETFEKAVAALARERAKET